MRSLRKLAAWTLLAVMAIAVAPREFWHACEHVTLAHHADEHSTSVTASCAMCDLGLPVGTGSAPVELALVTEIRLPAMAAAVLGTSLGFTPLAADRGPPATC